LAPKIRAAMAKITISSWLSPIILVPLISF
jgi:hypothetical protein